jgi:GUN4-like/TIR domain
MTKPKYEFQIFLAHAFEDKPQVLELYDKLKTEGYKPWLDKKDLMPGQRWRDEIPKAIKRSDIFIACFSKISISKEGYVQREYRLALDTYAEKAMGTIYLIPLRLDDCQLPDLSNREYNINLLDFHWVDYWEASGFEQLISSLEYQRCGGLIEKTSEYNQEDPLIISPPLLVKFNTIQLKIEKTDYTKLRDLLAAGKWKEADKETARLLLQVANRGSLELLDKISIDNFPCENLKIIDQLWLHYSKGKFGFSVQKEIYQRLEGTREYNDGVWKKFGDTVGWRVNDEWLDYNDMTFSLEARIGHLPVGLAGVAPRDVVGAFLLRSDL